MRIPVSRRLGLLALAAASAMALAGIDRASAADKVSVAVIPIADCAPIFVGKEKGFFAKQNIELDLSTAGGGAAIIPGVISGQMQFGFSNVSSMLIAQTKGLN